MNTRSRAADFMDTSIETTVTSISPPPRNRKAVSLADKYALSNEHHEAAKRTSLTLQEDGTAHPPKREKAVRPICDRDLTYHYILFTYHFIYEFKERCHK